MKEDVHEFLTCLDTDIIDVNFEWECFLILLDKLMRLSMSKVTPTISESASYDATKSLKQKGIKGAFMKRIVHNAKRCNPLLSKGEVYLHKLRKRVARLYELKQMLCQRNNAGPSQKFDQICSILIHRLQLGDQGWKRQHVVTTIRAAQVALEQAENKVRNLRLNSWKNRFCADIIKYAGRWLKKRDACSEVNIHTSKGYCETQQEAVTEICGFWTNFWSHAEETGPPISEIGAQLVANAVSHETVWNDLEGVHYSRIAVDMKGSAGGDGWTGLEVPRLPPVVWDLFSMISKRWLTQGELPHMILQARTGFYPQK